MVSIADPLFFENGGVERVLICQKQGGKKDGGRISQVVEEQAPVPIGNDAFMQLFPINCSVYRFFVSRSSPVNNSKNRESPFQSSRF